MDKRWSVELYSLFRLLLGGFCCVHFAMLLPYAVELFSSAGMVPDAGLSPLSQAFPNVLALYDAPWFVVMLTAAAATAGASLAAGWQDKTAALFLVYVLACFFGRNPLIANPGLPYLGWILMAHLFVPAAPALYATLRGRGDPAGNWQMPRAIVVAAWVILALTYSYSGYTKLLSPSWSAGETVSLVLDNPLARDNMVRDLLLLAPAILLQGLTWVILYVELLFAPLALSRRLRPVIWGIMLVVQFGFLTLLNFADLTFPMLLIHLLTFDPGWLRQCGVSAEKNFRSNSQAANRAPIVK